MKFTRLDSTEMEYSTQDASPDSHNTYEYLDDLLDKTFIAHYFLERAGSIDVHEIKSSHNISSSSPSSSPSSLSLSL